MPGFRFAVSYWNCGSGLVRKWDFIKSYIDENEPDIFYIAEADLTANTDVRFLKVPGYRTEVANTMLTKGKCRIICFCRPFFQRLTQLEGDQNELIVLKHDRNVICGIYRPFKCYLGETQTSNLNRLLTSLAGVTDAFGKRTNKLFLGDYNIHLENLSCRMRMALEAWADDGSLTQMVDFKTRSRTVEGKVQSSMIDLVYSNVESLDVSGEFNDLSDHIILSCKGKRNTNKQIKKKIAYVDWRKYNREDMRTEFLSGFKGINIHIRSPDEINDRITSAIISGLNKLAPKRETTIHDGNSVINPVIQNLKNRKIRIYKQFSKIKSVENFNKLKEVSKLLNKEIKKERVKSLKSSLNKSSKEFWVSTNKMLGRKIQDPVELIDEGIIVPMDEVAERFANFFSNKVRDMSDRCSYLEENVLIPESREFHRYTELEVGMAIDGLKRSKAQGFDEIPGQVIKDLKSDLLMPLCWLFNAISEWKEIPKPWKISKIIPVLKKGSPKIMSNYRPVSNVSSLCKVFERCVLFKLRATVDNERLFGGHQHGFSPRKSTTTAALTLQDFISTRLDSNKIVLMYSADLSAAFDMLRPGEMVRNLLRLGVNSNLIKLIHNFLLGRLSYVQSGDSVSYVKEVPIGCVQGSVLGPALFNIYTRELEETVGVDFFKIA